MGVKVSYADPPPPCPAVATQLHNPREWLRAGEWKDQQVQMVENQAAKRECPILTLLDTYWELHLELGLQDDLHLALALVLFLFSILERFFFSL